MWGFLLENRAFDTEREKYKFTSKERDDESSYDYFGARYYMSRIGRWGSVDVFQDNYISYSPYNYVTNNPIAFIDPNGFLVWWGVDQVYSEEFLNQLRGITGLDLYISEGGYLEYNKNWVIIGGSITARDYLIKAIDDPKKTLEIYTRTFLNGEFLKSKGELGGTIINVNPVEVEKFTKGVRGNLDPLSLSWGMDCFHEIMHTSFGLSIDHDDAKNFGDRGAVVDEVNKIRKDIGMPERLSYGPFIIPIWDRFGNIIIGKERYLPFDKESFNIMDKMLRENVEYKLKGKYIKY